MWKAPLVRYPLFLFAVVGVLIIGYVRCGPGPPVTNSSPSGETVICFGDSLTAGAGAVAGQAYPDHLERLLGRPVVNAGVSGDTTGQALFRLEEDVLNRSPRIVLITLGGNDLKNGVDRTEAFANLEEIVSLIHRRGALVVVGGIDIPLYGRGFDDAYEELRAKTGCLLVPDVYDDIMGNRALMADRIHPNGDGYRIMARHFYETLKPYL